MKYIHSSPGRFMKLGWNIISKSHGGSNWVCKRRYRAHFGTDWENVYDIWGLILQLDNLSTSLEEKHLLWALLHCKLYATEEVIASLVDVYEKTFRKWSYTVRKLLTIVIEQKVSDVTTILFKNVFLTLLLFFTGSI